MVCKLCKIPHDMAMTNLLSADHLAELAGVPGRSLPPAQGISFHSGHVKKGDIFFALPGEHGHGIAFADEALAAGAAFIVSDKSHPKGLLVPDPAGLLLTLGGEARTRFKGAVVGITGSAGKTSTKAMAAAALDAYSSPGNFNTPLALAQALVETVLAQERESEAAKEALVLELGVDRRGDMDGLASLVKPSHGVLTLIAPSHLSGLGSVDEVAFEKGKLIRSAPVALVNESCQGYFADLLESRPFERFEGDDPVGAQHAAPLHNAPLQDTNRQKHLFLYGLESEEADFSGRVLEESATSQRLEVLGRQFALPYPGKTMAANAVAAMALASMLGADLDEAAKRIQNVRLEPRRLEVKRLSDFTLIDDSYNSNPASLSAALQVLSRFPRPHTAILGDMLELGERSVELHREAGERTRGLDRLITVGEMARHFAPGNDEHFETVEALLEGLKGLSFTGAVLVKASRGIKLERVVERLEARP
jgi:UDP-N-acetylmuramoyl-tripeptide--D-alanyl-D-alanine ligase